MHVYIIGAAHFEWWKVKVKVILQGQKWKKQTFLGGYHVYLIDLHIWSGKKVKVNDDLQGQR